METKCKRIEQINKLKRQNKFPFPITLQCKIYKTYDKALSLY